MSILSQAFPGGVWPDTDFNSEQPVAVDLVPLIGTEAASKVAFYIRQSAKIQYRDNTPQQWTLMNLAAQIENRISSEEAKKL
jgi:hypothetical protein